MTHNGLKENIFFVMVHFLLCIIVEVNSCLYIFFMSLKLWVMRFNTVERDSISSTRQRVMPVTGNTVTTGGHDIAPEFFRQHGALH